MGDMEERRRKSEEDYFRRKEQELVEKLRRKAEAEAERKGLAEAIGLCKDALRKLAAAGIPIIRLGLQTTRELEEPGAVVAGARSQLKVARASAARPTEIKESVFVRVTAAEIATDVPR